MNNNNSFELAGNKSDVFSGTLVILTQSEESKSDYDYRGAMYFTVAVVLVYGCSIVGLIAIHMKGSQENKEEETQIELYMKRVGRLNRKEEKHKLLTLQESLGFANYDVPGRTKGHKKYKLPAESVSIRFVNEIPKQDCWDSSQMRQCVVGKDMSANVIRSAMGFHKQSRIKPAISVLEPIEEEGVGGKTTAIVGDQSGQREFVINGSDSERFYVHHQLHGDAVYKAIDDCHNHALKNLYSYINTKGQLKIRSTGEERNIGQPCCDQYSPTQTSHSQYPTDLSYTYKHDVDKFQGTFSRDRVRRTIDSKTINVWVFPVVSEEELKTGRERDTERNTINNTVHPAEGFSNDE